LYIKLLETEYEDNSSVEQCQTTNWFTAT